MLIRAYCLVLLPFWRSYFARTRVEVLKHLELCIIFELEANSWRDAGGIGHKGTKLKNSAARIVDRQAGLPYSPLPHWHFCSKNSLAVFVASASFQVAGLSSVYFRSVGSP